MFLTFFHCYNAMFVRLRSLNKKDNNSNFLLHKLQKSQRTWKKRGLRRESGWDTSIIGVHRLPPPHHSHPRPVFIEIWCNSVSHKTALYPRHSIWDGLWWSPWVNFSLLNASCLVLLFCKSFCSNFISTWIGALRKLQGLNTPPGVFRLLVMS